jgi:transcriptional regulator with XRE-family HTH domain
MAATTSNTHVSARTPFGQLIKRWRQVRGRTQLDLSLDAGISSRHLSFLETGRSAPSRDMVHLLCRSLNLPLRESNALFEAAGYARPYSESHFSQEERDVADRAIKLILANQEPYPAIVMDRHWNILQSNDAARNFFSTLLADATAPPPQNVIRLMFHQQWLKPYVVSWPAVAAALLDRVRREAVCGVIDDATHQLLDEVLTYPDVSQTLSGAWKGHHEFSPILPVEFRREKLHASFFSTVTTLGTPQDIALQELRIECFFPADETTRKGWHGAA